ncbi:FHA domain-containing protein [Kitasatospora sp. NPDC056138]|uniref:FHA domain-containing protein n=1 Tax=Kitasatospora sp. NPDC056138 TaxID=3345724 RepID=UPI0035D557BE
MAPPSFPAPQEPTAGLVTCPICRTPQTGRYCEECGYDYDLSAPSGRQHRAAPPVGGPRGGDQNGGGYGFPPPAPAPYQPPMPPPAPAPSPYQPPTPPPAPTPEPSPFPPPAPGRMSFDGGGAPAPNAPGYDGSSPFAPADPYARRDPYAQPQAAPYENADPYARDQYAKADPYAKAAPYETGAPYEGGQPYEKAAAFPDPEGFERTGPVYAQPGPTAPGDEFGTSFRLAPPANAPAAPPQPARTTWIAVVSADRDYFTDMMARSGPEAAGLFFPPYCPERRIPLTGRGQLRIGRRSQHRGTVPEIDLSVAPEDPGASHQHALLAEQTDGSWVLVDQDSTNGTTVNGGSEPVPPHTAIPLTDGDRIHVGAWTTITLHRA